MGKFQRNKRENLKMRCLQYLDGKRCKLCGVDWLPQICYDFHHNKGIKEEEISKMIGRGVKWSVLKEELNKCVILCKNCHSLTHSELQLYYIKQGDKA